MSPLLLLLLSQSYELEPRPIASGVYVVEGKNEDFDRDNGGDIANVGVLIGPAGVVLIDAGPSLRYGEALRAALARLSEAPVVAILLTHAHPDHFLGAGAFPEAPLFALPGAAAHLAAHGEALTENMYRLLGGWMRGTSVRAVTTPLSPGPAEFGGRKLDLLALRGHHGDDLAVVDRESQTLFAGDLVFFGRAPTTPDADLGPWLTSLDALAELRARIVVPGHGPAHPDGAGIDSTRSYLRWLDHALEKAAAHGQGPTEIWDMEPPTGLSGLAVARAELRRSVMHLYSAYEAASLPMVSPDGQKDTSN